jgi:hypothetical protein
MTCSLKRKMLLFFSSCDWYSKEAMSVVVVGDLHNFYRCIAVHCNTELQLAKRNESGSLRVPGVWKSEDELTDGIRREVLSFLQAQQAKGHLNDIEELVNDRFVDQHHLHRTLAERLRGICMQNLECVDPLEFSAVAYLAKTQIHVFEEIDAGYKLRTKYPCHVYSTRQPITLLYKVRVSGKEHFDVLLVDGCSKHHTAVRDGSLNAYAYSATDEEKKITFEQLLNAS